MPTTVIDQSVGESRRQAERAKKILSESGYRQPTMDEAKIHALLAIAEAICAVAQSSEKRFHRE